MKKSCWIALIILGAILIATTASFGYSAESTPQQLAIQTTNTAIDALYDGNSTTTWTYVGNNQDQTIILGFSEFRYVDYIQIEGLTGLLEDCSLYYLDGNGIWQPFIRRIHTKLYNGLLDLSRSLANAGGIKLVVHNSSLNTTGSLLGEIKVFGHNKEDQTMIKGIVNASSENPSYPRAFMVDGNTRTSWRSGNNQGQTVTYSLNETATVNRLKVFVKAGSGIATFKALVNNEWTSFGTSVNLATWNDGWHTITVPGLTTNAVRIEIAGNTSNTYVGGIAEIQVWGETDREVRRTLFLKDNLTGKTSIGIGIDELACWTNAEIWLTFPTTVTNCNLTLNVNGYVVPVTPEVIQTSLYNLVKVPVSIDQLRQGNNVITMDLGTLNAINASLILSKSFGKIEPTFIGFSGNLSKLFDGYRYSGANAGLSSNYLDITWSKTASIDAIRLYGNYQTMNLTNIYVWQNSLWVPLNIGDWTTNGNDIFIAGGSIPTTQIRLQFSQSIVASINEVEIYGSETCQQTPPEITILTPQADAMFSQGTIIEIKGYVDNPEATVWVDGNLATKDGHYFSCSIEAAPSGNRVSSVTATDGQGQTGQRSVSYNVGSSLNLSCDLDEVVYTTDSQIAITGSVSGANAVKINSQNAVISSGSYSGQVVLEEGENRVTIEATDINGAIIRKELRIILDTQAPALTVLAPGNNENVTNSVRVRGIISDISPVSVTANGKPINVHDGIVDGNYEFTADSQGPQTLRIIATDSAGHQTEVDVQVMVTIISKGSGGEEDEDDYVSPDFDNIAVLESAKDAPNPFGGYFSSTSERVSSGNLDISTTDLTLPGRNGLNLVIKRSYNSATAYSDSSYENNTYDKRKILVKFFGGKGWSLNIPYIYKTFPNGHRQRFLRLPEGQTVAIPEEDLDGWEYHKSGINLKFKLKWVTSSSFNYKVYSSDGTLWEFDYAGKLISQTDPSGKSVITYSYVGNLLDTIVDSAGRIIKFKYDANNNLSSIVVNGETMVRYEYDADQYLWKVYDRKNRATEYNYTPRYDFRTSFLRVNSFAWYQCNLKLLNQVKYATGMVSQYQYLELSQDCMYQPISPAPYVVVDPEPYYGRKFMVQTHKIGSNLLETYTYQFNTPKVGVAAKGITPPNYYLVRSEVISDKGKIIDDYIHLTNKDGSAPNPSLYEYAGSLLKYRWTYKSVNPDVEFEKITYNYWVKERNMSKEEHLRGTNYYKIDYTYDPWGSIETTIDSRTQTKKKVDHYEGEGLSHIHTLPFLITETIIDPVTGLPKNKYTQYTYNDPANPTKPDSITVYDDTNSYTSYMTYYPNGDLKSRTVPVRDGVNLKVDFLYEYTQNAQNEIIGCRTQETTHVTNADGTTQEAISKSHTNYFGLIDWEMNSRGYYTAYRYDELGRMILKILPDDNDLPFIEPNYITNPNLPVSAIDNPVQESIYDDTLNRATFINENCQRADYVYDEQGRLYQVTQYHNGVPETTVIKYNPDNTVSSVTDPRGTATPYIDGDFTTWYEYDGIGRATKVIYPGETPGDKTTFVTIDYDDVNNRVTYTNPNGQVIAVEEYNMSQQLIKATKYSTFEGDTETYVWEFQYDAYGNKISEKKPAIKDQETGQYLTPAEFKYEYHPISNKLVKATLPETFGLVPAHTTDKATLVNSTGFIQPVITYGLDYMGNRTQVTDANGNVTNLVYDELGRVIKTVQTYKQYNMTTGQEAPVTVETVNQYDLGGNRTEVKIGGKTWAYEYSARGQLLSERDPAGNLIQYRYDPLGNKIAVIDPRNSNPTTDVSKKIWYRFEGEGVNRRLIIADPRIDKTYTTWMVYDDRNRLVRTVMPDRTPPADPYKATPDYDNAYTEVTYDSVGNKLSVRDANGVVAGNVYNARNLVKESYVNNVLKQRFEYDKAGNPIKIYTKIKDGVFTCSKADYDSLGRVRRAITPNDEDMVMTEYDAFGRKIKVKAGTVSSTGFHTVITQYNQLGKVVWTQDPLGNKTQVRYDPNGNPVANIAANGLVSIARYDEFNRVVQAWDPLGMPSWISYDSFGNRAGMIDRRGTKWVYNYTVNNLVQQIALTGIDNSTYQVNYQYDAAGNRIKVWDTGSLNNVIIYNDLDSDPLNRINSVERQFDNSTYRTEYQYDKGGLLTALTYPDNSGTVTYRYNDLSQLDEVVGFTQPQSISYAEDGLLESYTLANGIKTSFSYDENRRLEEMDIANGGTGIIRSTFTFDTYGNITHILDRITNQEKLYAYDANNQLTSAVTPGEFVASDPSNGTCGFEAFDYVGKSQLRFDIQQDAVIRLDYASNSVGIDLGGAKSVAILQIVPDASHSAHRLFVGSFDIYASTNNSTYTLIPASQWEYKREANGTITLKFKQLVTSRYFKVHVKFDDRMIDFGANQNKATFLNELAKMVRVFEGSNAQREDYRYDAAGNRTRLTVTLIDSTTSEYTYYPNSDRLMTNGNGKFAFVYDNAGNMIKKGNRYRIENNQVIFTATGGEGVEYWEYTFDLLNRLVEAKKNGAVTAKYGYDPEGLRVVKWAHNDRIHYVFEGTEPIFEKRISDGKVHNYIFGLGKRLARVDGVIGSSQSKVYYYHTDHLGSIKAVTDAQAKVVWKADYLAFGERFKAEGSDGFDDWHGFTGKVFDPDSNLYYFNARWYDPELGRFISEDPAADPANPNLYTYCGNNPVIRTDPTGQFWQLIVGAILGAVNAARNGGSFEDILQGAMFGFAWGCISMGVGEFIQVNCFGIPLNDYMSFGTQVMLSATSGGVVSGLKTAFSGGNVSKSFGIGFISGGIMTLASSFLPKDWFNNVNTTQDNGGLSSDDISFDPKYANTRYKSSGSDLSSDYGTQNNILDEGLGGDNFYNFENVTMDTNTGFNSIGFDGRDTELYRFSGNNQTSFIDGKNIYFDCDNVSNPFEYYSKYQEAKFYLMNSPTARRMFDYLENSSVEIVIVFNNKGLNAYNPDNRGVLWDPTKGHFFSNGRIQSPALSLAHEMGHAYLDSQFINCEENNLLIETQIANELGEPTRMFYDDAWMMINVPDVLFHN